MSSHQIRFQGPRPLLSSFSERPASRHPGTDAAEEDFGVDPLEGLGQNVADIGQVEQEQRHSDDGVEDGRHLAPLSAWRDVSVAWRRIGHDKWVNEQKLRHYYYKCCCCCCWKL